MMFEYRWLESALDKLATIYVAMDVPDRDRVAAGVEAFNARIENNPLEEGESRSGGFRMAFPPLLVVYFHVDAPARRVRVTDVARFGR